MAYGEMITTLRADLSQLEKDLNKALKLYDRYNEQAVKVATTTLRAAASGGRAGSGGGGGGAATTAVDAQFRYMQSQRNAAEAEQRRLSAAQQQAFNEERRRVSALETARQQALNEENRRIQQIEEARAAAFREDQQREKAAQQQFMRLEAARAAAEREDAARTKKLQQENAQVLKVKADQQRRIAEQDIALARKIDQEEKTAETLRARMRADNIRKNAEEETALSKKILAEEEKREKEFQAYRAKVFQQAGRRGVAVLEAGGVPQEIEKVNTGLNQTKAHLKAANRLMSQFRQAVRVTAGYTAAIGAGSLVAGVALLGKEALKLNVEYDHNRQTIAHILGMTTQWVDQQGKAVSQAQQLNLDYAQADRLLPQIRMQAAKLNMTFEEGAKIFAEGFGIAGKHGITPEKAVPIIGQISELAKELGSDPLREVRALLGGLRPAQSKILLNVGLDPKSLRKAMESGHLLDYLNTVMVRGLPFLKDYEKHWEVVTTALTTSAQEVLRIATQRVFERITEQLGGVNKAFSEENVQKWGKQFGDALINAYNSVDRFVHSDAFKTFEDFFKFLANNAKTLLEVFAAWKGAMLVGATTKGIQGLAQSAGGAGAAEGAAGATAGLGMQILGGGGLAGLVRAGIVFDVVKLIEGAMAILNQQQAFHQGERTEADIRHMRLNPLIRARLQADSRLERAEGTLRLSRPQYEANPHYPPYVVEHKKEVDEYNKALAAKQAADKAYQDNQDKLTGKAAKTRQAGLHQEFLQYQHFQDSKLKDELYLKRLQAKDKDDYVHEVHAKLSAAILAADKALHTDADKIKARKILEKNAHEELDKLRTKERLQAQLDIAQNLGDKKGAIDAQAALDAQDARENMVDKGLLAKKLVSIEKGAARERLQVNRDYTEKALGLVKQYQEAIHKEHAERAANAKKVHDLEVRFSKQFLQLTEQRKKAVEDLYRTEAEEAIKAQKVAAEAARDSAREQLRATLQGTGAFAALRQQFINPEMLQGRTAQIVAARRAEMQRGGKTIFDPGDMARLQFESQGQAQAGLENDFKLASEQLLDRLLGNQIKGPDVISGILAKPETQRALEGKLPSAAEINEGRLTAGEAGVTEGLAGYAEAHQKTGEDVHDLGQAVTDQKRKLVELQDQETALIQSYKTAAKELKDNVLNDFKNIHTTLSKLVPQIKTMYDQLKASNVPIPPQLKGILPSATNAPTLAQVTAAGGGVPQVVNIFNITTHSPEETARQVGNTIRAQALRGNPVR